ncbi:MAG TPA: small ribosomal subunit Rsm22 family protein [Planctomycetota bacterium]|nr:small ribosomal subunit Rsm22 family protein [Planctomycetota bacterium]
MQVLEHEWAQLAQLRERFLGGRGETSQDYWENARICELYDATFAQRIAWKWRAVWGELARRDRMPRAGRVLDWGCGGGIAAREFSAARLASGADDPLHVHLWDRSAAAREFAAGKLREADPKAKIELGLPAADAPIDLLLVSHVLGELDGRSLEQLTDLARRARCVVWVEPGSREISRELMALRDSLLPGRSILGPCTHSAICGLNIPGRERDWCHSFAKPAPEVFSRADWREFSHRLKIDLRSVPYAYFALSEASPAPAEPDLIRIIGRPRLEKGLARIDACDVSGVRNLRLLKRDAKQLFKEFADASTLARTFRIVVEGDRVRSIE